MAAPSDKQWGLTPPISIALPTPTDVAQNLSMIEDLRRQNNYESLAEIEKRHNTLIELHNITTEFVREVSRRKGYSESQIAEFGGTVFPYGSYRLGVFGPGKSLC